MNRSTMPREPSPEATRALDAFRKQSGLSPDAKAALRARIDASIAAGVSPEVSDAPSRPSSPPIDIARSAWRIGVGLAAAAGVLLAIRLAGGGGTLDEVRSPSAEQAVFEAERKRAPERPVADVTPAPPSESSTEVRPEPGLEPTPEVESAPEPTVEPELEPTVSSRTPASRPKSAREPRREPTTSGSDLAAELALMQRARSSLSAGDPQRALQHLATHAKRFAQGQLLEDREALRIQALCDAGRKAEAQKAARRFIARHPGSPHASKVHRICDGS